MLVGKKNALAFVKCVPVVALGLFWATSAQANQNHVVYDTEDSATAQTVMSAQQAVGTQQSVNAAFDRLSFLNSSVPRSGSGFSSGEKSFGINLWANPYYSYVHDQNVSTGYQGDTFGAFFGGDYAMNSQFTLGLMLGVDNTNIETKINNGGSDTTGVTVAPYARYALSKTYSADATFGYTTSNSDSDRLAAGTRVTGSSDTSRWFGALGVNSSFWQDRWNYQARVGTSMSRDHRDSFTESNTIYVASASTDFAQAQIGGTVSYYFEKVRPWLSATYAYDYTRKLAEVAAGQVAPSDDRDQVTLGLGATIFGYGNVTGDISLKQVVFKKNFDSTTVGFTVSSTF